MSQGAAGREELFGAVPQELALQTAIPLRRVLDQEVAQLGAGLADNPFLIALAGLPGTGKSHFARELRKRLPLVVLESDRLRKVLVAHPDYTAAESARLFAACHLLIEEYLSRGRQVLFDATNLTENFRRPLSRIARRASASMVLVRFTAPQGVVRRRLAEREAGRHPSDYSDAGWLIYSRMEPYEEAVPGRHLAIDSSADISGPLEEVVRLVAGEGKRPSAAGDSPARCWREAPGPSGG